MSANIDKEISELTEDYIKNMTNIISQYSQVEHSINETQKEISNIKVVLRYFSQKWVFEIIILLFMRNLKFNELRDLLGGISSRILTDKLRILEKAEFVSRSIVNEAPIKIQYSITEKGKQIALSLYPIIHQIKKKNISQSI
jgi:DNA-binding HxlR family transcriptional regulator